MNESALYLSMIDVNDSINVNSKHSVNHLCMAWNRLDCVQAVCSTRGSGWTDSTDDYSQSHQQLAGLPVSPVAMYTEPRGTLVDVHKHSLKMIRIQEGSCSMRTWPPRHFQPTTSRIVCDCRACDVTWPSSFPFCLPWLDHMRKDQHSEEGKDVAT